MHSLKSLILIADDEPQIRKMLRITLEAAGYKTEEAKSGKEAIRLIASIRPDLVLLDLGLPDIDGTEVIRQTREWSNVPIIIISAHSEEERMIKAFNMGSDDYVIKPFSVELLLARIQSTLRRAIVEEVNDTSLTLGDIEIDLLRHEIKVKGEVVQFSPKEYNLLAYLISNRGKMLTHTQILNKIWGPSHTYDTQYLRVYIGQLRKKIDLDSDKTSYIVTEAGIGYRAEIAQTKEEASL
ncbi:MAG: response regulator transcription factor [Alphaproteobacteria bacterium]